jgi:hypothetical protein
VSDVGVASVVSRLLQKVVVLARWLSHKIQVRIWVGDNPLGELKGPAFEIRGPTSLPFRCAGQTFTLQATDLTYLKTLNIVRWPLGNGYVR